MEIGILYDFRNPAQWQRPFPDLYHEILDEIAVADSVGIPAIWLCEHHFVDDGWSPSVLPLAAAVAARTSRVRIGTGALVLPLNNPLRVAEDCAIVDILSNGRLEFGATMGYRPTEFAGFGVPKKRRGALLEEGLEIIRRAWTEERFSFEGQHYHLRNVSLRPKPVQRPHPPIYVGAISEPALRRCAKLGFHLFMSGTKPAIYQSYVQALRAYGRDPAKFRVATSLPTFIAEDPEEAWHNIKHHCLYQHNTFHAWTVEAGVPFSPLGHLTDPDLLPKSRMICDPDSFVRLMETAVQTVPIHHVTVWTRYPGMSGDKALRSVELIAKKVVPRLAQLGHLDDAV